MIRNCIHEEFQYSLRSGSTWCHSVQNVLSFSLLSKNTMIKIYRAKFCLLFCVGVELGLSHSGRNIG
jgi:hypothetical protein